MSDIEQVLQEVREFRKDRERDREDWDKEREASLIVHKRIDTSLGKIKEAVWQEDRGLFARVRANTTARKIGTFLMAGIYIAVIGGFVREVLK